MPPLLRCEKISFAYGERNLFSQLSFEVKPHEFWVISGESGIGKSTLLKVLTGEILSPTGHIEKTKAWSEIPQSLALCSGLSAFDAVASGSLQSLPWWRSLFSFPTPIRQHVVTLAQTLKVDHVLSQNISQLSGGEKQRIAMARSLIGPAKLFIVDEPISMLDEKRAWESLLMMKEQIFARQGSLICVLHQTPLIQKLATHQISLSSEHPQGWKIL